MIPRKEEPSPDTRPQRRTIILDFAMREKVKIKELDRTGVVIAIHFDGEGIQYKLRYFDNAEPREVYFFEWELTTA